MKIRLTVALYLPITVIVFVNSISNTRSICHWYRPGVFINLFAVHFSRLLVIIYDWEWKDVSQILVLENSLFHDHVWLEIIWEWWSDETRSIESLHYVPWSSFHSRFMSHNILWGWRINFIVPVNGLSFYQPFIVTLL